MNAQALSQRDASLCVHFSGVCSRVFRSAMTAASLLVFMSAAASVAHAVSEETVYDFCSQKNSHTGYCDDGGQPSGNLASHLGNLYGSTVAGGLHNGGTVFEIGSGGGETVIYNFCSARKCTDGQRPTNAGPIFATGGNLYGTTEYGGLYGYGTAYELTNQGGSWAHKVIHNFCNQHHNPPCKDGGYPKASLLAAGGALYGTAGGGGTHGAGTIFELVYDAASSTWGAHVLYNFCSQSGCADGATPQAGLVKSGSDRLFGTTAGGGATDSGTVFELAYNSKLHVWKERVLHSFCSSPSCADGSAPVAPLVIDGAGILYGTASAGGNGDPGYGVVFEIMPVDHFSVLHAFCNPSGSNCNDGITPVAGLALDGTGNLHGTTSGDISSAGGGGTVFTLTLPSGSESPDYVFCSQSGCPDGSAPAGGVVVNGKGEVFGTTANGGKNGGGVVFKLSP